MRAFPFLLMLALLALLLLLAAFPAQGAPAPAAGASPVGYPSITNPIAALAKAQAGTNASHSAYDEVVSLSYNATAGEAGPACSLGPCTGSTTWVLVNYSNLQRGVNASIVAQAETWINSTVGNCGLYLGASCPVTYTCDGVAMGSYARVPETVSYAKPCLDFALNWSSGSYGTDILPTPAFNVTRILTLDFVLKGNWSVADNTTLAQSAAISFRSLDTATWHLYNNSATNCHKSILIPPRPGCFNETGSIAALARGGGGLLSAWWWVNYPAGQWDLARTSVVETDTNTAIPSTNLTVTQTSILLAWTAFPLVSTNVTQHFRFAMLSLSPLGTTGPSRNEVVLTLGNLTYGLPATASASWQNLGSDNFTGSFYLEGAWLAGASGIGVYANGVQVPAYETSISGTAIVVYAGYVPVASGASVTFVVHFTAGLLFTIGQPLLVIGGVTLTMGSLMVLAGIVAGIVVLWVRARDGPKEGSPIVFGIGAVAIFFAFWLWVVAG